MNFIQVTSYGVVRLINVELISQIYKCSNTSYRVCFDGTSIEVDSENAEIVFRAIGKRFE